MIAGRAQLRGVVKGAVVASLIWLVVLLLMAGIGPSLSRYSVEDADLAAVFQPPSAAHFFGTDENGRDVLLMTLHGARVSVAVAVAATAITVFVGTLFGAIAGTYGGRIDRVMMAIVDATYAMPYVVFLLALFTILSRSLIVILFAIAAVEWLTVARVVRSQTLILRRAAFVEAALAAGAGRLAIIRRHIVPNVVGLVVVSATLTVPGVIFAESFLSFLGLGLPDPYTSWGKLIAQGAQQIETAPWILAFPSGFMTVTLLAVNRIGEGLRESLNPNNVGGNPR